MARKRIEHIFIGGIEYKYCSKCKEYKPLSDFGENSTRWDKLHYRCKACRSEYSKSRRKKKGRGKKGKKRKEHKIIGGIECKHCPACQKYKPLSEFGNSSKTWDKLFGYCKACVRENNKKHYQNNKESCKEYGREYYQNNKESCKEYSRKHRKEYRQNNPEIFKVSDNRRRAKKKALPADLTAKQWDKNMKYFNYSCALTGKKENIHQEHFIPISILHGGTTEENMYPMEGCLNVSKSNKNPFEWIKEQPEEYQNNFHNNLVPYMAKKNKMQVKEYEDFVYWCFANPRTLEQAEKDNEKGLTSKDLFYQSVNFMGGCRS